MKRSWESRGEDKKNQREKRKAEETLYYELYYCNNEVGGYIGKGCRCEKRPSRQAEEDSYGTEGAGEEYALIGLIQFKQ